MKITKAPKEIDISDRCPKIHLLPTKDGFYWITYKYLDSKNVHTELAQFMFTHNDIDDSVKGFCIYTLMSDEAIYHYEIEILQFEEIIPPDWVKKILNIT
jgi:hypothetical protein